MAKISRKLLNLYASLEFQVAHVSLFLTHVPPHKRLKLLHREAPSVEVPLIRRLHDGHNVNAEIA